MIDYWNQLRASNRTEDIDEVAQKDLQDTIEEAGWVNIKEDPSPDIKT